MVAAVQEALHLKQLSDAFGIQQKLPIAIAEHNQIFIKKCQNPVMHKWSKDVETKFHFVRNSFDGKRL